MLSALHLGGWPHNNIHAPCQIGHEYASAHRGATQEAVNFACCFFQVVRVTLVWGRYLLGGRSWWCNPRNSQPSRIIVWGKKGCVFHLSE